MDHEEQLIPLLCSYGKRHRRRAFLPQATFAPMIDDCAGHIFTDERIGVSSQVEIYRDDWMHRGCIGVRGDKGQVASLLRVPTLIFDDKEMNIELLRARSTPDNIMDGVLVSRGRNLRRRVPPGYYIQNHYQDWVSTMLSFAHEPDSTVNRMRRLARTHL